MVDAVWHQTYRSYRECKMEDVQDQEDPTGGCKNTSDTQLRILQDIHEVYGSYVRHETTQSELWRSLDVYTCQTYRHVGEYPTGTVSWTV